jgi:hypothetical protein
MLSNGRLKILGIAMAFIFLGYLVTWTLAPVEEDILDLDATDSYDPASGGVLTDPTGFGSKLAESTEEVADGQTESTGDDSVEDEKEASVSAALSDLRQAVTDKLQSWNPYKPRPQIGPSPRPSNETLKPAAKSKKPLNSTVTSPAGEHIKDGYGDESLGARTRIGKCTILFNGKDYWERAIRTHEEHDKIHGYRLHVLRQKLLDDVWDKPAYILSLILRELSKPESERLQWLFWVDADTIILNPNVPVEAFLPPADFEDVHLVYTADWNGLNNGIFPVKVNQWSVDLFSAIVAYRYYRPQNFLLFRDQSAMGELLKEPKFAKHIVAAPQRWFNAYQGEHNETMAPFQIRRGDLLVHFPGVPDRESRMGYWLDRAEQHLDDWELPLKATSYPQETKDFWNEQRALREEKKGKTAEIRVQAVSMLTKTNQKLDEFHDRLGQEQADAIRSAHEKLRKLMDTPEWDQDLEKVDALMQNLEVQSEPLNAIIANVHKTLLIAAHDAIFAGEKDLLDADFGSRTSFDPTLQRVSDTVKALKNLVMSPQEHWSKQDVTAATEAVTKARGDWMEQEAGRSEREKLLEETKKQLEAEAGQGAGGANVGDKGAGGKVAGEKPAGQKVAVQKSADWKRPTSASSSGPDAMVTGDPEPAPAPALAPGIMVTVTPEPVYVKSVVDPAVVSPEPQAGSGPNGVVGNPVG